MEALDELARRCGIEPGYWDIAGNWHTTSADTSRALWPPWVSMPARRALWQPGSSGSGLPRPCRTRPRSACCRPISASAARGASPARPMASGRGVPVTSAISRTWPAWPRWPGAEQR